MVVDTKEDTEDVQLAREPVVRSRLNVERAIILFVKVQFYCIMSYSREHQDADVFITYPPSSPTPGSKTVSQSAIKVS